MNFKKLGFTEGLSGQRITMEVVADVNDADYIRESYKLGAEELITLLPIVTKIREAYSNNNWEDSSTYLSEEEIEVFEEYIPYMDNQEVHTIDEIIITAYDGDVYTY